MAGSSVRRTHTSKIGFWPCNRVALNTIRCGASDTDRPGNGFSLSDRARVPPRQNAYEAFTRPSDGKTAADWWRMSRAEL